MACQNLPHRSPKHILCKKVIEASMPRFPRSKECSLSMARFRARWNRYPGCSSCKRQDQVPPHKTLLHRPSSSLSPLRRRQCPVNKENSLRQAQHQCSRSKSRSGRESISHWKTKSEKCLLRSRSKSELLRESKNPVHTCRDIQSPLYLGRTIQVGRMNNSPCH